MREEFEDSVMNINNPHLKKMAEGRTEITTKMICEAERLENEPRLAYKRYMALGMQNIYACSQEQLREYDLAQEKMLGDSWAGRGLAISDTLGVPHNVYHLGRCPYCGK